MSTVYLKIGSLLIRTLSKPIASRIKSQAREHEGFRNVCISFAQAVHRVDMRLRLGLLQDQASIERQIARDAAEARAKKAKSEIPTVKTEAQSKIDEVTEKRAKEKAERLEKEGREPKPKPKIRPLSEGKAIDSGANFISETFLFSVGLGLIVFETWRSRRKENKRRDDVAERIAELEEREQVLTDRLESVDEELQELRKKEKWFFQNRPGERDPKRPSVKEEVEKKVNERRRQVEEAEAAEVKHNSSSVFKSRISRGTSEPKTSSEAEKPEPSTSAGAPRKP